MFKKGVIEEPTSQLNSRSDSMVQILTVKFLACFLLSELKAISLAAIALAMAGVCCNFNRGS